MVTVADPGKVFLEHHIPSRILHFSKHELGWSCATLETCECTIPEIPLRTTNAGAPSRLWARLSSDELRADLPNRWRAIVESYTKLKFTKITDRLPALSGIASIMSIASDDQYLFGLWLSGLQLGEHLCWRVLDGASAQKQPTNYAPTWSWASLEAPVSFHISLDVAPHRFTVTFKNYDCQLASSNAFGPGTGLLRLKAPLIPINVNDECGFSTDRTVDYEATDHMAQLYEADEMSDPNPSAMIPPIPKQPDLFGKSIQDLPDILSGDINPDRFPLPEDDGKFYFFIVLETVDDSGYGEPDLYRPHGLILHKETTGRMVRFTRVGWGESWGTMPTEWWKTCGSTESIALV